MRTANDSYVSLKFIVEIKLSPVKCSPGKIGRMNSLKDTSDTWAKIKIFGIT